MVPIWQKYYVTDNPFGMMHSHAGISISRYSGPLTTVAPSLSRPIVNNPTAPPTKRTPLPPRRANAPVTSTLVSLACAILLLFSALGVAICKLQWLISGRNIKLCRHHYFVNGCSPQVYEADFSHFHSELQHQPHSICNSQEVPSTDFAAPPAWCMAAAGGDDACAINLDDWRNFRASLVKGDQHASASPRTGPWAHMLGIPEPGCLLVAQPQHFRFSQKYFQFAVVLLVEHDEEGTLGLILNCPLGSTMGEVHDVDAVFSKNPLYFGGDVGRRTRILHPFSGLKKSAQIIPGVYTSALDQVLPIVQEDCKKAADVKFFCGYAGWGPGQLQRECDDGVWWVMAASSDIPMRDCVDPSKPLWCEVLELCGGDWAKIAKQKYRS
eukprot:GGOE01022106.1.p1 GENE.GGOE01022106.1~~GGOE01022106.1.p1  ORF type:complete len:435 (-),score=39.68 GGOE01022106.1:201-1346(-)